MPFSKNGLKHGHEKDGTENADYCRLCYQDGAFLQPAIKRTSMQHLVMHSLQRGGWPKPLAWLATRHIRWLKRWKKGKYQ
jgi:hypothetical protein